MKMQNRPALKPYTTTPRSIVSDVRSGKMTLNEWIIYQWLRNNSDPYGKVVTSLSDLIEDVLQGRGENYANRLLLSLRRKKYLFFHPRTGRRGTFEVYLGDIQRPDGKIGTLDHFFGKGVDEALDPPLEASQSEVSRTSIASDQKSAGQKAQRVAEYKKKFLGKGTGRYNEHDSQPEHENDDTLGKKNFSGREGLTRTEDFIPESAEEERCKEMASRLGDENINPLLAALRRYGMNALERSFGIYCEDKQAGKKIGNRGAYFTGVLQKNYPNK